MGGESPEWVPVYDGGIYFNYLPPRIPAARRRAAGRRGRKSLKTGHRAFKIKVGRGFKWMEKKLDSNGTSRCSKAIRKTVGKEVKLAVDANNGFDLETHKKVARRFG